MSRIDWFGDQQLPSRTDGVKCGQRTPGMVTGRDTEETIVVLVPASRFREVFRRILNSGAARCRAIETYDVVDHFSDPSGRLAVRPDWTRSPDAGCRQMKSSTFSTNMAYTTM